MGLMVFARILPEDRQEPLLGDRLRCWTTRATRPTLRRKPDPSPWPVPARRGVAGPNLDRCPGEQLAARPVRAAHDRLMRRSRRALRMTDTELKVIAALASIGLSRIPKAG
jgi:hypothetical protein